MVEVKQSYDSSMLYLIIDLPVVTTFSRWNAPLSACRVSTGHWNMCNIHRWSCCGAEFGWFLPRWATLWRLQTQACHTVIPLFTAGYFYITLLPFETLTCRRSSVHTGASAQRGRFHGLGKLWPCTFFMLEALSLLLALTRKKKGHLILILILIVCTHRMHTLHTGRGGFAIWSFNISIASWCGSAFFANFFASPFLHTHTHTQ